MFESVESLARGRLRQLQNRRLSRLVADLAQRSPFYQKRFERAGIDPQQVSLDDLPRLPFTTKEDLRSQYPFGLFGMPLNEVRRIHASSGTTGKPTVVGYSAADLEIFAAVNARSLYAAGARPGMMLHNAYGYGLFTGGLGLHCGAEKLRMNVVPVSGGMTERQIMLIQDFQPHVISCTPSYAQTLAGAFRERGVEPRAISLRFALLGAEPWTETIRREVEEGLGVRATNIYGLSEIIGPGVSQECVEARSGSHIWEDHFYPEIIDPQTWEPAAEDQPGVLVLTTLTRHCQPLIRYWTGDVTHLIREPCSCGRTHVKMGRILGRTDDMLIIRGVNIYPTQLEAAIEDLEEVVPHHQIVLTRREKLDQLEWRLEIAEDLMQHLGTQFSKDHPRVTELKDRITQRLRERVGIRVEVTLMPPGSLPASEGGKLNRIVDRR